MKTYFPFLRGKQNELMALRELADEIATNGHLTPIIEPVKNNPNTRISLDRFTQVSMPFLLICNPMHGEFVNRVDDLFSELIENDLMEYDNWTPVIQVGRDTRPGEVSEFLDRYDRYLVAALYQGLPSNPETRTLLERNSFERHLFVGNRVENAYVNGIEQSARVMIVDRFHRQVRNADYPEREFFSDMNTPSGNPDRLCFGDFSMVGDVYSDTGGPAYAVTVHHIHFNGRHPGPLDVSHFISDRTETTADTPGKIIEAVQKLVAALNHLRPANTDACDEYREMAEDEVSRGLGYLKRLAIQHHLELMMDGGNLLG